MTTALGPDLRPYGVPPAQASSPGSRRVAPARAGQLWRGRAGDPSWVRPALLALLGLTAVLYLWDLGASGWANSYYAAAVQAGSTSWKAMFFGSFDASSFITVDKTPASLWVMSLSARLFGDSSWSMLVPQALIGVAAVGLLHATVRRVAPPAAGLLAGAVLALTPVATLMFRFNNPDALLVLLLIGSVHAVLRALEHASTRWLALAGVLLGFGYLTKMLQAFLLLPVLAVVYLYAAPTSLRRRLGQLLVAGAALVVSAGWWIAAVALWPGARPYIGGSQTDSVLELTLGYNGLGRLTGAETGSVGGANGWGQTGWTRLFTGSYGGQASWLVPASLIVLAAGLWLLRRVPRTDRRRASLLLWGGWLVVHVLVFSFMQGIIHEYYTVALAPAIGALVGTLGVALWQARAALLPRAVLAAAVVISAWWAAVLLARTPTFHPELRTVVLLAGSAGAALLLGAPLLSRTASAALAALLLVATLAGPAAAAVETAATPHTGSIVTAGPAVAGARGPGGGARPGFAPGGPPGGTAPGGTTPAGTAAGGLGGLLNASTPSAELVSALGADASSYRWVAAAVGANSAAGVQLASGLPVMAIGGFNGSDPTPTLAAFQAHVAAGDVHYFLASGSRSGPGTSSTGTSAQITAWVSANFPATTIGGVTVYDLTAPTG